MKQPEAEKQAYFLQDVAEILVGLGLVCHSAKGILINNYAKGSTK